MPEPELPAELAAHLTDDMSSVLEGVRAEAVRRVRAKLVDAYVDALERQLASLRGPTPEPAATATTRAAGTGCYLYAVVDGDGTGAGEGAGGVSSDGRVRLVPVDGLTAVVSDVDLEWLSGLSAATDIDESSPLTHAVCAHDAVVDAAFRAGAVVPMRFGTVLTDDTAAAALVRRHAPTLRAELSRLSGVREWGVKLVAVAHDNEDAAPDDEPVASGRDYLLTRSRDRASRAAADARLRDAVALVQHSLAGVALEVVAGPTRHDASMHLLLNESYLVPTSDEQRFLDACDELAGRAADAGLQLERTGPWPPYHFVRIDLAGEAL
jgi:hypothetical protein